jgi:hypothetical protein
VWQVAGVVMILGDVSMFNIIQQETMPMSLGAMSLNHLSAID